jgi:hypothetical protein
MSKVFKFFALCVSVVFLASSSLYAEVIDVPVNITINVVLAGSSSMTVTTRNVVGDALVAPSALNFSGAAAIGLPPANPWVVSDQYIRVQYSSNYGLWGVRIVTDNEDLEGDANDTVDTIASAVAAPSVAISGLLNLAEIVKPLASQDPSVRAPWAWQVFADTQPLITSPSSSIGVTGALEDSNVGAWNANWAYIADKNDTGYSGAILVDADADGQVDDPTYGMVVVGGGSGGGALAQHPAASPKNGDGDIAVYISARFANTNFGGATPAPYLLPAGSYSTSLYVELIHE